MIRVCGVFGTWQLITLVASLQQAAEDRRKQGKGDSEKYEDYLLLYETAGVSQEFKEILRRMAETVWPWRRIAWAYDILINERKFSQREYERRCRILQERLGVSADGPDELWVCWLSRPAEKLLFGAFPRAAIVLYEDGLITYLDVPLARLDGEGNRGSFAALQTILLKQWEKRFPVARFRRSRWAMDIRHRARLRGAYLLLSKDATLSEALAHVPPRFVDDRFVRRALADASPALPADAAKTAATRSDSCHSAAPRVLILGQALSRNGIMPRDEEREFYERIVQTVLGKGYDVLWKDHPRVSEPFFEELRHWAGARGRSEPARVTRLSLPHACPVEIIADRLNLAACVAGTSAALFYLRRLYGIPCYSFAVELLPRMRGADVVMNDRVRREIPSLDELPLASDAPRGAQKENA